jgi:hypothetical protein
MDKRKFLNFWKFRFWKNSRSSPGADPWGEGVIGVITPPPKKAKKKVSIYNTHNSYFYT